MAPPKGDDNARGDKARRTDSASPGAYVHVDRGSRGQRRWQLEDAERNSSEEPERSTAREIIIASGVIDTVAEPQPDTRGAANTNDVAGRELEPELPVRRSYVREGGAVAWTSPFAQPAQSADEDTEVPPLPEEALRPARSAPTSERSSSWLFKGWILLMCLILGAAGLVAVRGERPRAASVPHAGPSVQEQRDVAASAAAKSAEPAAQAPAMPAGPGTDALVGSAMPASVEARGSAREQNKEAPVSAPKPAGNVEKPATDTRQRAAEAKADVTVEQEQAASPAEAKAPPIAEAADPIAAPKDAPREDAPPEPVPAPSSSGLPDNPYDAPAEPAAE